MPCVDELSAEDRRTIITTFRREFNVVAWYGKATKRWWALGPRGWGRLLEAERPGQLAEQVRQRMYGTHR